MDCWPEFADKKMLKNLNNKENNMDNQPFGITVDRTSVKSTWKTKEGETKNTYSVFDTNGADFITYEDEIGAAAPGTPFTVTGRPAKGRDQGKTVINKYKEKKNYNNDSGGKSKGSNASFALSYAKDYGVSAMAGGINYSPENIMETASKFKEWLDANV